MFQVKAGKELTQSARETGPYGYWFATDDGREIAQFRVDGFTFSRLNPYTSWETIFPRAFELWRLYADLTSAEVVTRVAVRYINHLKIPLPIRELRDYLEAPPLIPVALPQHLVAFLTRSVIHDVTTDTSVNITQASEPSVDEKYATVLLDIDAFRVVDLAPSDESLESIFGTLRQTKNHVFFSSITEKAKGLFA